MPEELPPPERCTCSTSGEKELKFNADHLNVVQRLLLYSRPSKLHERSPIFMGSKDEVEDLLKIIERHRNENKA